MTPDERLLRRLERLAERLQPKVQRTYLRALAVLRAAPADAPLEAAVTTAIAGDVAPLLELIFGSPAAVAALNGVGDAVRGALTDAAATWATDAALVPPAPIAGTAGTSAAANARAASVGASRVVAAARAPVVVRMTFDAAHPAVLDIVRTFRMDTLTKLTDEMRVGVRAAVQVGAEAGENPRVIARGLRETIGFTDYDTQLLASFRRQLQSGDPAVFGRALRDGRFDRAIRAAIAEGRALPAKTVDTYVEAYGRRLRAWRSETVARTAALDAARLGQEAIVRQALDEGRMTADRVTVRWVTRLDGRERAQHRRMHGQTVRFGEAFRDASSGRTWAHVGAGDYNCRCTPSVKIHASARLAAQALTPGAGQPPAGAEPAGGAAPPSAPPARPLRPGMARTPPAPPGGRPVDNVPEELPLIRVPDGAIAPAGTTGRPLTKAAFAHVRATSQGQTFILADGQRALVGRTGLAHATRDAAYEPQGQMFAAFQEILQRAVPVQPEAPREGSPPELQQVHKYLALVQVGDRAPDIVQATHHDVGLGTLRFYDLRIWNPPLPPTKAPG